MDEAAKVPKTAMKDLWLKSKEKSVAELKETPFASQRGESSNDPANHAGEQMLSGIETTVKRGAELTYQGGKKLAQTTIRRIKEKREISRPLSEAKNAGGSTVKTVKNTASKIRTKNTSVKSIKGKPQKAVKNASRSMKSVKQSTKGIKTAQRTAKTTQQTAKAAAKATQKTAQAAKATAKSAATGAKAAVKATIATVKGLISAIAAGGWVAVLIILLICLIAMVSGSCFGLFFSSDLTGTGTSVTQAVSTLNEEYMAHMQEIEAATPHDRQEITSNDGVLSINWEDILAVFSAKVTGTEDGVQVASLDDAQLDELRNIMWEMNAISSGTRTEKREVEITEVDENGKKITRTETVPETILEISIQNNHPAIIPRETFYQIQEELARRRSKKPASVKKTKTNHGRFTSKYALSERLVCGDCGCYFRRVTWSIHGRKQIVWRCINRLEFGPQACKNSPSLKETALQASILDAIRSLICGQQEEMAAVLQDTLIRCIAEEKDESNPAVIESQIKKLESEFDRLLIFAVSENDIVDQKLKQISESILQLKQKKKRIEYSMEHSKVMEAKTKEVMALISAEGLNLTEYSDTLVFRIVEKVTVLSSEEIKIRFIGGFEITQPLY